MQSTTVIVDHVSAFFTGAIGWMGDVVDLIVSKPFLFLMVGGVVLAGFAIGGLRRLIRL